MATRGRPAEPCGYDRISCCGLDVKIESIRKVFVVTTVALLIIVGVCATLYIKCSTSLAWKIITPLSCGAMAIPSVISYLILARAYNIAPKGFYKICPAS